MAGVKRVGAKALRLIVGYSASLLVAEVKRGKPWMPHTRCVLLKSLFCRCCCGGALFEQAGVDHWYLR